MNCSTTTTCLSCSANYILTNQTCFFCNASNNYFPNYVTQTCDLCNLNNCLNCASLTTCSACNTNNSFYLTTGNICAYCDPTLNYFISTPSNNCVLCTITGCLNCSSLAECQTCN